MNIIICDDNPVHAKKMEEIVAKYQETNGGHREVYTNLEVLHAQIGEHLQGDVYLMDIEWGDTQELIDGGIKLAESIYNMNPRARIIYTTAHMGAHAQEFFLHRANIAGLINKPVDPVVLYQHLDQIKEDLRKDDYAYWTVSYRSTKYHVPFNNIAYIEGDNHRIHVYMINGNQIDLSRQLSSILDELPNQFVQCHRSYVVNMDEIKSIQTTGIQLQSSEAYIPIGKTYQESLKKHYFRYMETL